MNNPKVSIIIPTLNRKNFLFNVLEALRGQSIEDYEVIIVDQSDDPIKSIPVDFLRDKVNVYSLEQKGSHRARNYAVKKADAEVLIFLDDDVEILRDDFIENHLRNYEDEDIGLVVGREVRQGQEDNRTEKVGRVSSNLLIVTSNFNSEKRQETNNFIGCNFSCRKEIWNDLEGFDTNFRGAANLEETDFSLRVQKKGGKIVFDPETPVKHLEAPEGGQREKAESRREKYYWIFYNYVYLFRKHGNSLLWPIFLLYLLARATYYMIKEGDIMIMYSSYFKGVWDRFFKKKDIYF